MARKRFFTNWPLTASFLLMAGAVAWALKLAVIISTNGRIIDTGAAAFLMKIGILLLLAGSTSLGCSVTSNRGIFVRIIAFIASPLFIFGACFLLTMALHPLVDSSDVWYASQELPIAVVVLVCLPLGVFFFRRFRPAIG